MVPNSTAKADLSPNKGFTIYNPIIEQSTPDLHSLIGLRSVGAVSISEAVNLAGRNDFRTVRSSRQGMHIPAGNSRPYARTFAN